MTAVAGDMASDVLSRLQGAGHQNAVILDGRKRPIQWLNRRQISRMQVITDQVDANLAVVSDRSTLNDALDVMLVGSVSAAIVTGRRDAFLGLVTVDTVMDSIRAAQEAAKGDADSPVGLNSGAIPTTAAAAALASGAPAGTPEGTPDEDGRP